MPLEAEARRGDDKTRMKGVNATTGKALQDIEHLKQSMRDILTTPIGERVMRRDYGSELYQLIDAPITRAIIARIYSAVITALLKWEPRFYPQQVTITSATPGKLEFDISGIHIPSGQPVLVIGLIV